MKLKSALSAFPILIDVVDGFVDFRLADPRYRVTVAKHDQKTVFPKNAISLRVKFVQIESMDVLTSCDDIEGISIEYFFIGGAQPETEPQSDEVKSGYT